jgi:hypothetical protein
MPRPTSSHALPWTRLIGVLVVATSAIVLGALAIVRADVGQPQSTTVSVRATSVGQLLAADMSGASEALPHGVPRTYDWAARPRVKPISLARSFRAFTGWGQLYRCAQSARPPGRAVELKGMESWAFSKSARRWRLLQRSSELSGASYPEDFKGPTGFAVVVRRDATGTAVRLRTGYNFHFWPSGPRAALRVADTLGVAVLVRARFVPGADASPPCAVLSVGGDFWRTGSVGVGPGNTADAGIGRFKRVGPRWRAYTMTSASRALLHRHPLPARLAAGEAR